jgi:hypothetical protein
MPNGSMNIKRKMASQGLEAEKGQQASDELMKLIEYIPFKVLDQRSWILFRSSFSGTCSTLRTCGKRNHPEMKATPTAIRKLGGFYWCSRSEQTTALLMAAGMPLTHAGSV